LQRNRGATVANAVATLKRLGRNHLLVVEAATGRRRARVAWRSFSRSQIERQLGTSLDITPDREQLLEIEQALSDGGTDAVCRSSGRRQPGRADVTRWRAGEDRADQPARLLRATPAATPNVGDAIARPRERQRAVVDPSEAQHQKVEHP
jgi:hypothetical protein